MELVGKLLGNRYEVVEKVGIGGMASVYKAKDKTLNRYVAIKALKDEYAEDQEFIRRFQIEAQSAASLSHPNIVSIFDVSEWEGIHYIVMELIEGKTLKDVINEKGKLPWREACEIASQIAAGLAVAHKNHIVHRDIKPHNIIMTKDNLAKITDFGIAKAVSSSTINANANSLGSVHYFSPEHARGGYTDEKSDIYSLGIVLYEMVTGKLPFDGDTAVSIAMKHLKDTPEEPIKIVEDIPQGLNDIIMKAMQKEVGSRYQSAGDMLKDLQKVMQSPDTTSVGRISSKEDVFATQKVPMVNRNVSTRMVDNKVHNDDRNIRTTKKKKKKNPVYLIIIRLALLLLIFGLAVGFAILIMNNLLGSNVEQKVVPNVVGNSYDVAKKKLEAAGFQIEKIGTKESSLPKDYVINQKYASGDIKPVNTKIGVTLSEGMAKVKVENVVEYSLTAATSILNAQGLKVEVTERESNDVLEGKIIEQIPAAGEIAYKDDTVTLVVSKGGENGIVVVPDLSKFTEEQALDAIQVLDLVGERHYAKDANEEEGKILFQTPEANKEVKMGTTVKFYVNKLTDDNPDEVIEVVPSEEYINGQEQNKPQSETSTTPAPTAKPGDAVDYKVMTILLSNLGTRDTFNVRVELNGDIRGRTVIYNQNHSRSEGVLDVKYPADATGVLRVYIDNELSSEQPLE